MSLLADKVLCDPVRGTVEMRDSLAHLGSDLECPLCHEVFQNPSTLSSCGHTFCEVCILKYSKDNYQCPGAYSTSTA
jgi:formylmethanofuran dehydrogenase subunit E